MAISRPISASAKMSPRSSASEEAKKAESEAEAAKMRVRAAKAELKKARKLLKVAKKAAKRARKNAQAAAVVRERARSAKKKRSKSTTDSGGGEAVKPLKSSVAKANEAAHPGSPRKPKPKPPRSPAEVAKSVIRGMTDTKPPKRGAPAARAEKRKAVNAPKHAPVDVIPAATPASTAMISAAESPFAADAVSANTLSGAPNQRPVP